MLSSINFISSDELYFFVKLSGSSPSGSFTILTFIPSLSIRSIFRKAAFTPASSLSKIKVIFLENLLMSLIWSLLKAVPDDDTTFFMLF